jgi:hypothetical protein
LRGRPQLCLRMQRQKVKGTGHKQPADAQTEPNFYAMPASHASHPHTPSPPSEPASSSLSYNEMSPGLQGLHGAANLLKGMAAGLPTSSMSTGAFSLGAAARAMPTAPAMGSTMYQPSPGGVSLLGRMATSEEGNTSPQTRPSQAFYWPNRPQRSHRVVYSSPSHAQHSTDEDSADMNHSHQESV